MHPSVEGPPLTKRVDTWLKQCGTHILAHAFSLDSELEFFIYLLKNMIFFFFKDLKSPLIFVLFLKEKQNKKEKP